MNSIVKVLAIGMVGCCVNAMADDGQATAAHKPLQYMQPLPEIQQNPTQCLQATGSHIASKTACLDGAHGRVYGNDDFVQSGGTTWADALARDPAITIVSGGHR